MTNEEKEHVRASITQLSEEMRRCAGSIEARNQSKESIKLANKIRKVEQEIVNLGNILYFKGEEV